MNDFLTRRRFLRLTATVSSGLALGLSVPMPLWAAEQGGSLFPAPPNKPRGPRLLMIDPGHGGRDPGAIGRTHATHEKDVTLDIARRMADALSAQPSVRVKMTRDEDVFLPLEDRVKLSRDAGADLFISIHADSAPQASARGLSVYTLSEKASDDFSKELADHENKADMMGGMDLPPADKDVTAILFDLATRRTRNTAQHARANFVSSLKHNWRLLDQPMRAANFVVLRAPDVPSMLVETGFLSNPKDEAILRQPLERARIAKLMARDLTTILNGSLFS
jgi:N-acetylmuramoyl-L-alanine amidase